MDRAGAEVVEFGRFRVDRRRRELLADGQSVELSGRAFADERRRRQGDRGARAPGEIGEPGTAVTAPALANGTYAATGKRLRKLLLQPLARTTR